MQEKVNLMYENIYDYKDLHEKRITCFVVE